MQRTQKKKRSIKIKANSRTGKQKIFFEVSVGESRRRRLDEFLYQESKWPIPPFCVCRVVVISYECISLPMLYTFIFMRVRVGVRFFIIFEENVLAISY